MDKRCNNGGAREGAGRPISNPLLLQLQEFVWEKEVVVSEFRHGQIRRVKKPVILVTMERLSKQCLKDGDKKAVKIALDLILGKPVQPDRPPKFTPDIYLKALAKTGLLGHFFDRYHIKALILKKLEMLNSAATRSKVT